MRSRSMPVRHSLDPERAKRVAVARQYRREGYRVTVPARGDPVPRFLDGMTPDLIAEREDDRVVVEIKRADRVAGSNDLIALAERVGSQSGWRLEFISVPPPAEAGLLEKGSLDGDVVDQLIGQGAFRAAFLLRFAEMENILSWAAVAEGRRLASDLPALAGDLVSLGALPGEILPAIRQAAAMRNRIVHGIAGAAPDRSDLLRLNETVDLLRREIAADRAA